VASIILRLLLAIFAARLYLPAKLRYCAGARCHAVAAICVD
jgi:hypothetical protein